MRKSRLKRRNMMLGFFMWVFEVQTQILQFLGQALYWVSHLPSPSISSINARSCVFKKHTVGDMPKCSTSHSTAAIKHVDQALLKGGVGLFGLHFQVIVHHEGKPWREIQARARKQPCLLFHTALPLTRVSLTTTAAQRTITKEDFLLAHCHAHA